MDEEYLEFPLWLYMHQTGEILAIEDIEKCVTEGNAEKKAEIDAYVDWHDMDGGGGEDSIKYYAREYDKNLVYTVGWTALTPQQQQDFVLEMDELYGTTYD